MRLLLNKVFYGAFVFYIWAGWSTIPYDNCSNSKGKTRITFTGVRNHSLVPVENVLLGRCTGSRRACASSSIFVFKARAELPISACKARYSSIVTRL